MPDSTTARELAEMLRVPVDRLLMQLGEAGIQVSGANDVISEDAKLELLTHLRRSHGKRDTPTSSPRNITLKRKPQSELKLSGNQGRARTVSVEVRRKRTYTRRDGLEAEARKQQAELDTARTEQEARDSAAASEERRREKAREMALEWADKLRAEAAELTPPISDEELDALLEQVEHYLREAYADIRTQRLLCQAKHDSNQRLFETLLGTGIRHENRSS